MKTQFPLSICSLACIMLTLTPSYVVSQNESCTDSYNGPILLRNGKTEGIDSSRFEPTTSAGNEGVLVADIPGSGAVNLKYVQHFLSDDETQKLISFCDGRSGWTASPQNYGGDGTVVESSRTSNSCPIIWPLLYLPKLAALKESGRLTKAIEDEITSSWSLMQRIANFLKVDVARIEPFQLIRYNPGQFYRRHHDHGSYYGAKTEQRPITYLIFLSSMPESDGGGHTRFGDLDISVLPRAGDGIVWSNVDDDGNLLMEAVHEAVPPNNDGKVVKFAMNVWIADEPIMNNIDVASYRTQ